MNGQNNSPQDIFDIHILPLIERDIGSLLRLSPSGQNIPAYAVIMLILSYSDFLGTLHCGGERFHISKGIPYRGTSPEAVRFMRKYFGAIDPDYKEVSGILYQIWRHGVVHLAHPQRIRMNSRVLMSWAVDFSTNEKAITAGRGHLLISLPKLYEDFVEAVKLLRRDVMRSRRRHERFVHGWNEVQRVSTWSSLRFRRNGRRRNRHLTDADYRFICKRNP